MHYEFELYGSVLFHTLHGTSLGLQAEATNATNESVLKVALDHGKAAGIIKPHDRIVVCQKVGDSSVVKIIELEE